MKTRLITGISLGVFFLITILFLPGIFIPFFMSALTIYALNEYYGILIKTGLNPARLIGYAFSCFLICGTYLLLHNTPVENSLRMSNYESCLLGGCVIAFFLREMSIKDHSRIIANLSTEVFGVLYIPFLLNFILKLAFMFRGDSLESIPFGGRLLLLYGIATVKFSDAGAFFTGKFCGKHKLLPRVSPKKTWEGFVGGLVASIIVSFILCYFTDFTFGTLKFRLVDAIVLPVLMTFSGLAGDLCESLLKRDSGIKDSSNDIPGIGGILDVLDSLITALPILYIYAVYVIGMN